MAVTRKSSCTNELHVELAVFCFFFPHGTPFLLEGTDDRQADCGYSVLGVWQTFSRCIKRACLIKETLYWSVLVAKDKM